MSAAINKLPASNQDTKESRWQIGWISLLQVDQEEVQEEMEENPGTKGYLGREGGLRAEVGN